MIKFRKIKLDLDRFLETIHYYIGQSIYISVFNILILLVILKLGINILLYKETYTFKIFFRTMVYKRCQMSSKSFLLLK